MISYADSLAEIHTTQQSHHILILHMINKLFHGVKGLRPRENEMVFVENQRSIILED